MSMWLPLELGSSLMFRNAAWNATLSVSVANKPIVNKVNIKNFLFIHLLDEDEWCWWLLDIDDWVLPVGAALIGIWMLFCTPSRIIWL